MKTVYFLLLTAVLIIACDKPVDSEHEITDLTIVQTNTPSTGAVNQDIVSSIRVQGPNLCYRFEYFTVNPQQFLVDIHAKGTIPAGPAVCADMIYHKDTTLLTRANTPGQYILRFYNGNQLFKSDTVQVN